MTVHRSVQPPLIHFFKYTNVKITVFYTTMHSLVQVFSEAHFPIKKKYTSTVKNMNLISI